MPTRVVTGASPTALHRAGSSLFLEVHVARMKSWNWRFGAGLLAFAVLLAALLGSGCSGRDTCSGGENMTDPRASFAAGPPADLVVAWSPGTGPGASLPDAYFGAVRLAEGQEDLPVAGVAYLGERRLGVTFGDLAAHLAAAATFSFLLEFPDRRGFVACSHPGMADRYLLRVALRFGGGAFGEAEFEQLVHPGAL